MLPPSCRRNWLTMSARSSPRPAGVFSVLTVLTSIMVKNGDAKPVLANAVDEAISADD